jgi:hypothetical protein
LPPNGPFLIVQLAFLLADRPLAVVKVPLLLDNGHLAFLQLLGKLVHPGFQLGRAGRLPRPLQLLRIELSL